jgi:hypothetical protein
LVGQEVMTIKLYKINFNRELKIETYKLLCPNAEIKGLICGYRVESIENPLMQKIRYLDKLIDELARGKSMHY